MPFLYVDVEAFINFKTSEANLETVGKIKIKSVPQLVIKLGISCGGDCYLDNVSIPGCGVWLELGVGLLTPRSLYSRQVAGRGSDSRQLIAAPPTLGSEQ